MQPGDVGKITGLVARQFSCFGGGTRSVWGNPIADALKDKAPSFAMGVDVRAVVEFVIQQYEEMQCQRTG